MSVQALGGSKVESRLEPENGKPPLLAVSRIPAMVCQVIDENKQFNADVGAFLDGAGVENAGLNYHLVSVFGSQSTGKSTLLNALFGTSFGVMNEQSRGQTTKGIWMGVADRGVKKDNKDILILDVEGTDGRERGEDQDFERKAALFALATSEVLIVNMWESQVGLYQGANMGLLKTVFEVNLSLFLAGNASVSTAPRSKVLFVIRDYLGQTPLENLQATLKADLEKHWSQIAKPSGELEHSKLGDFFDIDFAVLPHKVLLPAQFAENVKTLQQWFVDPTNKNYVFDPNYHRQVPLDGWPLYADQIWTQIEQNKDLDLPTQQILVARFRCDDIANEAWKLFNLGLEQMALPLGGKNVVVPFGEPLKAVRDASLEYYDSRASRYTKTVYSEKRFELLGKIDGLLISYFHAQLAALELATLAVFRAAVAAASDADFAETAAAAEVQARHAFHEGATEATIDPSFYSHTAETAAFDSNLAAEAQQLRAKKLDAIAAKLKRTIAAKLDAQLPVVLGKAGPDTWLQVQQLVAQAEQDALKPFKDGADFGLGGPADENTRGKQQVSRAAWLALQQALARFTAEDWLVERLRDRFEDRFRYDDAGVPVVWKQGDNIEAAYVRARDGALELLPVISSARLPDGSILAIPTATTATAPKGDQSEAELVDLENLVSPATADNVRARFKRFADGAFLDAKRALAFSAVHIPYYFWLLLLVLGWNELMAVLRNPLLIMLVALLGGAAYLVYSLNMAGPVLSVAEAMVQRFTLEAKKIARQYLEEPSAPRNAASTATNATNATASRQRVSTKTEIGSGAGSGSDIELDDLKPKQ